ncbi:MAG: acetyl-CoA decarbonylase/synthase complex subunit gamma [Firmicutes bacterium]|nr:acetyl-CoA decarbonylase/synthase complex subunit gamma [Bacillota bacterium]
MGLTGLEIYKLLPKKNCGECGPPTCLAFAMQLAAAKASLDACPYVSDEARQALESASAPPIRLVTIGTGDAKLDIGDETVLFRHDKTFFHETGLAFEVSDALSRDQGQGQDQARDGGQDGLAGVVSQVNRLEFERVGQRLRVNLIAVRNDSGDPATFAASAAYIVSRTKLPLILISQDPVAMARALDAVGAGRPLIYAATQANLKDMAELARKYNCPLAVRGEGLDELANVADKVIKAGCKDLVLDPGRTGIADRLADLTQIRRLAIKKKFRTFGFPAMAFVGASDPYHEAMEAGVYIAKYAGIVVLKSRYPWLVLPLLTLRQNIYTDPQKPIQVEAKLYSVGGEPKDDSPLYVTSNFSLTFFTVQGDIEASKIPAHLLVIDTEGTSVLTAWAAGKFTAEKIAEALGAPEVQGRVRHRRVIIPGYVAAMSGKLEEKSGWQVLVGPRESAGIPSFVKAKWSA